MGWRGEQIIRGLTDQRSGGMRCLQAEQSHFSTALMNELD